MTPHANLEIKERMQCSTCLSEDLVFDTRSTWNCQTQAFDYEDTYDHDPYCRECEDEVGYSRYWNCDTPLNGLFQKISVSKENIALSQGREGYPVNAEVTESGESRFVVWGWPANRQEPTLLASARHFLESELLYSACLWARQHSVHLETRLGPLR